MRQCQFQRLSRLNWQGGRKAREIAEGGRGARFFSFLLELGRRGNRKVQVPWEGWRGKQQGPHSSKCVCLPSVKIGSPVKKYTVAKNVICCFALPYVRRKKIIKGSSRTYSTFSLGGIGFEHIMITDSCPLPFQSGEALKAQIVKRGGDTIAVFFCLTYSVTPQLFALGKRN